MAWKLNRSADGKFEITFYSNPNKTEEAGHEHGTWWVSSNKYFAQTEGVPTPDGYSYSFINQDIVHYTVLMNSQPDPMEKAIRNIGVYRMFRNAGREIQIACLIRQNDWRPLKASWWHGKEVCIIGADLIGNFFLRHCDGTVRYWDHSTKTDIVLSPCVRDFVAAIGE